MTPANQNVPVCGLAVATVRRFRLLRVGEYPRKGDQFLYCGDAPGEKRGWKAADADLLRGPVPSWYKGRYRRYRRRVLAKTPSVPALSVESRSPSDGIPLFSQLKDTVTASRVRGGIIFWWSRHGVGFGSLTLVAKRGKLTVDAEGMGPDFCAAIVKQAIVEATQPNSSGSQPRGQNADKPNP